MADPINVKVCMSDPDPHLDEVQSLSFGRLIEGPPKPNRNVGNLQNFSRGVHNGRSKMQCFTYMDEQIKVIILK
jgi:hypothetical protein